MASEAAAHGGSIAGGSGGLAMFMDPSMESSVVLGGMGYVSSISRGATPSALMLGFEERMEALSREMRLVRLLIHNMSQQIDIQTHEIHQMRELVHGMSQQLGSTGDSDPESERDEVELDYGTMEALTHVKPRSGVNWKAVPKARTYPDMFNIQYELDSEET